MNPKFYARQKSREFALQAIYQWQINPLKINEISEQFLQEESFNHADNSFFRILVEGVLDNDALIDSHIETHTSRKFKDIDMIDKAILRLAAFELLHFPNTPHKVILNEYIELSKSYSTEDSYRFINGVIDKIYQASMRNLNEK